MSGKRPADGLDELEAQVEALEAQLDKQSTQLRLLWGVLLISMSALVLLAVFPPSVVASLGLFFVIVLALVQVR